MDVLKASGARRRTLGRAGTAHLKARLDTWLGNSGRRITQSHSHELQTTSLELSATSNPRRYSYLKLSTGSSCAARVAGSVPKITPTNDDTTIAMIADNPEIGMRYSVKKRTENGIASPITMPMIPNINEIETASAKNWKRISRLVAPIAFRMPISRMRELTVASMMFMMPIPLTSNVTAAISSKPTVKAFAILSHTDSS